MVIAALYLGKGLLMPLTLAVLLSFLLSPMCDWLERRRLGRISAVLVTAIVGFTLLGGLAWTAAVQLTSLAPKIPGYQTNIEAKLSSLNGYAVSTLQQFTQNANSLEANLPLVAASNEGGSSDSLGSDNHPYSVRIVTAPSSPLQLLSRMSGSFSSLLGSIAIVIVLVVFFLIQREDLRDRFIRLIGNANVTVTTQTLEDAGSRVTRYLSTRCFLT